MDPQKKLSECVLSNKLLINTDIFFKCTSRILLFKYKKPFSYNMKTVENEASGIRTPDNLIKSQVLYRLS